MFQTYYPNLKLVTADAAREHLPELLRLAGEGERFVITDGGKWAAMVGPAPPTPPTPEEEEVLVEKRKEVIRGLVRDAIADGYPPPPESTIWQLFEEGGDRG